MVLLNREVKGLTDNSKRVKNGYMFVCVKGAAFDGHNAAEQAIDCGAEYIVCERDLGFGDKQIIVPDTRKIYGELCAEWFGNPQNKMKFIGVTGTNGKTTMTSVIKYILTGFGHKVGLIGTIQNEIGDEAVHTENTTPFAFELMELLAKMADAGCEYVVMEVSSFGLIQNRIGCLRFRVAVFTNLTRDHLDYHGDMESYYQAKKLLFERCENAVINIDDEYGRRLYNDCDSFSKYSYSCIDRGVNRGDTPHHYMEDLPAITQSELGNSSDFDAYDIKLHANGSEFWYNYYDEKNGCYTSALINTKITGLFNVSNLTAALAVCDILGLDVYRTFQIIEKYPGTRGRCEIIPTGKDFTVLCDYAHTPDALENVLKSVKGYCKGRLICLFGCGGNRDKTKRPLMGAAASKYADVIIVTSDNPRDEEPEDIIKDIIEGVTKKSESIPDRREAIARAIKIAKKDDIIILAGKGHEDYQILKNGEHIHFDEREVVSQLVANN